MFKRKYKKEWLRSEGSTRYFKSLTIRYIFKQIMFFVNYFKYIFLNKKK